MDLIYPDITRALTIHNNVLIISGNIEGKWWYTWIKELWNLSSALDTMQNDDYYPTFESKLTKLLFSTNKNHAFNDWNKRTSLALGAFFMEINGYGYSVGDFFVKMENVLIDIADNKITQDILLEIVTSILYEEDYSESLKVKLIDSVS